MILVVRWRASCLQDDGITGKTFQTPNSFVLVITFCSKRHHHPASTIRSGSVTKSCHDLTRNKKRKKKRVRAGHRCILQLLPRGEFHPIPCTSRSPSGYGRGSKIRPNGCKLAQARDGTNKRTLHRHVMWFIQLNPRPTVVDKQSQQIWETSHIDFL